jgi:hypothetical protein
LGGGISSDHPFEIPNLEDHSSWTSFNTIFTKKRSLFATAVKFAEKLSVVSAHVYYGRYVAVEESQI